MSAWWIKFKKIDFREHRALEPGRGATWVPELLKAAVIGITINMCYRNYNKHV
jgi:hypothetical protein